MPTTVAEKKKSVCKAECVRKISEEGRKEDKNET